MRVFAGEGALTDPADVGCVCDGAPIACWLAICWCGEACRLPYLRFAALTVGFSSGAASAACSLARAILVSISGCSGAWVFDSWCTLLLRLAASCDQLVGVVS